MMLSPAHIESFASLLASVADGAGITVVTMALLGALGHPAFVAETVILFGEVRVVVV